MFRKKSSRLLGGGTSQKKDSSKGVEAVAPTDNSSGTKQLHSAVTTAWGITDGGSHGIGSSAGGSGWGGGGGRSRRRSKSSNAIDNSKKSVRFMNSPSILHASSGLSPSGGGASGGHLSRSPHGKNRTFFLLQMLRGNDPQQQQTDETHPKDDNQV